MWYRILCSLLLFFWRIQAQERCPGLGITFEPIPSAFSSAPPAHLFCSISDPTWWSSSTPCGPFNESTLCPPGPNTCLLNVTSIQDKYYHCCTRSGETVSESSSSGRNCFYVDICTSFQDSSSPPFAFFGETHFIYIDVFSNSPALTTDSPRIQLSVPVTGAGTPTVHNLDSQVEAVRDPQQATSVSLQYTVPIPSLEEINITAPLNMFADFAFALTLSGQCPGPDGGIPFIRFKVHERQMPVPISTTPATAEPTVSSEATVSDPTTAASLSAKDCAIDQDLLALVVVFGVLFLVSSVSLVIVIIITCSVLAKRSAQTTFNSADSGRPNSLDVAQYSKLMVQGNTPSPFPGHLPHGTNGLPADGGHSNGTPMSSTTPLTTPSSHGAPNSLVIGVGRQPSHSGSTPLIAFTPAGDHGTNLPGFPNMRGSVSPPSFNQVVDTVISEEVPGNTYATVGKASGGGGGEGGGGRVGQAPSGGSGGGWSNGSTPIYSTTVIEELASNITLKGPGSSPQTDV